jgi:hypothetical protein
VFDEKPGDGFADSHGGAGDDDCFADGFHFYLRRESANSVATSYRQG